MRRQAVVAAVAGHERHPLAADVADHEAVGGGAVRRVHRHLLGVVEERVEPRPSEHPDLGAAHTSPPGVQIGGRGGVSTAGCVSLAGCGSCPAAGSDAGALPRRRPAAGRRARGGTGADARAAAAARPPASAPSAASIASCACSRSPLRAIASAASEISSCARRQHHLRHRRHPHLLLGAAWPCCARLAHRAPSLSDSHSADRPLRYARPRPATARAGRRRPPSARPCAATASARAAAAGTGRCPARRRCRRPGRAACSSRSSAGIERRAARSISSPDMPQRIARHMFSSRSRPG